MRLPRTTNDPELHVNQLFMATLYFLPDNESKTAGACVLAAAALSRSSVIAGVLQKWPNSDARLIIVTRVEELLALKQTDVSQPATPLINSFCQPPRCLVPGLFPCIPVEKTH